MELEQRPKTSQYQQKPTNAELRNMTETCEERKSLDNKNGLRLKKDDISQSTRKIGVIRKRWQKRR